MTYLLTQILLCLALALIAGAAIGWLINGHRAAKREHKIREELIRQSLALNQAETDNKMIEDDYRELKFRSEETQARLKEENKQIPQLNQNLDKSQTLVRQMLQKHDAEQRQLASENALLATKLKELENRERAVAKLQMGLNTERLNRKKTASAVEDDKPAIAADLLEKAMDTAVSDTALAEDNASVVQTEMPLDSATPSPDSSSDLPSDMIAQAISELEAVNEDAKPGILTEIGAASLDPQLSNKPGQSNKTENKSYDFGQSDHDDNLQELFGIGPVAERTLRKLGITSFEQLASLEREHIEYIADVLEIFPGRIERDDWVGSARKRVEQAKSSTTHESDLPELEDA